MYTPHYTSYWGRVEAINCIPALKSKLLSGHFICWTSSSEKSYSFFLLFVLSLSIVGISLAAGTGVHLSSDTSWGRDGTGNGLCENRFTHCQYTSTALAATVPCRPWCILRDDKWRWRLKSRTCQHRATKAGSSSRRSPMSKCPIYTQRGAQWHLDSSHSRWV